MFDELEQINARPNPFEFNTVMELWTDEHISKKMLEFHLNENIDVASRNKNFIERSVDWITSTFGVNGSSSICDFGCGPGLYTARLAEKGAKVTGIDFSKRSINYARNTAEQKNLTIEYVNRNYLSFDTDKKYELIIMIMCDFCVLNPEERKNLLQKFHRILKPAGYVLLDVYSLNAFGKKEETAKYQVNLNNGFWSPHQYYGFQNTIKYEDQKVILDKYTIIEKNRTRKFYNWLQYFSLESLRKEFVENNFIIHNYYSNLAGLEYKPDSDEIGIVAEKKD